MTILKVSFGTFYRSDAYVVFGIEHASIANFVVYAGIFYCRAETIDESEDYHTYERYEEDENTERQLFNAIYDFFFYFGRFIGYDGSAYIEDAQSDQDQRDE